MIFPALFPLHQDLAQVSLKWCSFLSAASGKAEAERPLRANVYPKKQSAGSTIASAFVRCRMARLFAESSRKVRTGDPMATRKALRPWAPGEDRSGERSPSPHLPIPR